MTCKFDSSERKGTFYSFYFELLVRQKFHFNAKMFGFLLEYLVDRTFISLPQKLKLFFKWSETGTGRVLSNILSFEFFKRAF